MDIKKCAGIGTDGASVMSSVEVGVAKYIKTAAPLVSHIACLSHALNLSIGKSTGTEELKNVISIVKEIYDFFQFAKESSYFK